MKIEIVEQTESSDCLDICGSYDNEENSILESI